MKTDVAGRVRNLGLAASKPLFPLYEAVINSIEAIQDASHNDGRIEIRILRDQNLLTEVEPTAGDVIGFVVRDNGIGFNEENYAAFETSDTTYKAQRGGKGVGRFLWLVAFDRVEVISHFKTGGSMKLRRFEFVPEDEGIKGMIELESSEMSARTEVQLLGFQSKYQKQCPKRLETIATHLIENCLEYFIRPDCPEIFLRDVDGEVLNLNERFDYEMVEKSLRERVTVGDQQFSVLHVRLHSKHVREHHVHCCAKGRVVKSEQLIGLIPNLARRLEDEDGREFAYAAYVDGAYLDQSVNAERTDFSIVEDESELLSEAITWRDIFRAVLADCQVFLEPYTAPVRERKLNRIDNFVATDGPMYRPILKYVEHKIDLIDPEITDDALDLKLYQAYHDLQVELKVEGSQLMMQDGLFTNWEDFERQLKEYMDKVSDVNKSDLARYVCHRRAILDFLQKQLSITHTGKYPIEERVHQIIFPLRRTSEEVLFDNHNLWLVDEKLVYHSFLASDKPLRKSQAIVSKSKKEPDIVIFDKAIAFATEQDGPFSAITIIEFKRPMRDDYDDIENPFVQVRKYINDIREGKARTPDGRDIPIANNIPFFCYIICDKTPTLEQQAYDFELTKTADGQGFFGFKRQYNAYFELISYTKMVSDAKRRNVAFFDKLSLPSRIST